MPGARVRGIVFDLDGTLIDGYDGITTAVNAARAAFGMAPLSEADVRGRVGNGLTHLIADVVGEERVERGVAVFRETYDRVCEDGSRPAPELLPTLAALRARGYAMSVASNKPASYSRRILDRLGAASYFAAVEGPETAGALKPDPTMILACLRAMSVRPDEARYVGDMPLDVDAGARAGVEVILVAGGSSGAAELASTGKPVVASVAGLLEVLR